MRDGWMSCEKRRSVSRTFAVRCGLFSTSKADVREEERDTTKLLVQ